MSRLLYIFFNCLLCLRIVYNQMKIPVLSYYLHATWIQKFHVTYSLLFYWDVECKFWRFHYRNVMISRGISTMWHFTAVTQAPKKCYSTTKCTESNHQHHHHSRKDTLISSASEDIFPTIFDSFDWKFIIRFLYLASWMKRNLKFSV